MNILNTLLSLLFALLAGMILVFGLIVLFCILLFSTRLTLTLGETKMVTMFDRAGMVTEYYIYNQVTKPDAAQVDIEFDKADLLAKLAKEIAPNYSVYMKISRKNQTLTGISLKVDPNGNAWQANAKAQVKDDSLEDLSPDEQSYVFTCKQLNGSCILMSYNNQNKPTVQNLQLNDVIRLLLQTLSDMSQKPDDVGSTDTSENSQTEEKAEAHPSHEE